MATTTAGDGMIIFANNVLGHFASLRPVEIALDLVLSALIVGAAIGLDALFRRLVAGRVRRLPQGEMARQVRSSRALRLGVAVGRLALTLMAAGLLLSVWGFSPVAWWSGAAGQGVMRVAGRLVLLIMIFVAAFELAGFLIRRTMNNLATAARDPRRAAQLRTLSPLLRCVVLGTILIIAAMMLLSELGLKIGPLIAGAGVAGIAIGFGAQSLVKDVLTGFFLIVEDIVSVGDTVRIATCTGEVEQMTLRTIRLRDFDGTLHIFPYGEAQVIHNTTNVFSYAVIDLQISHDSDIDSALAAMKQVGEALKADPAFGPKIIAPIEVLGVENLKESGLQLRGRIKTRPNADSSVSREFNRRIKAAFDERGVVISYPQMRLVFPQDADQTPDAPAARSP